MKQHETEVIHKCNKPFIYVAYIYQAFIYTNIYANLFVLMSVLATNSKYNVYANS